jgi:flagellar biogenesis protein FliO
MDMVRQAFAILAVFALLWAALSFLRKPSWVRMPGWMGIRRTGPVPGLLESRGRLALTTRHSLHLIRIGDRNLILALHPGGITFLGDAQPEADSQSKKMAVT